MSFIIICESKEVRMKKYLEILANGLLSFIDDVLRFEDDNTIRVRIIDNFIFMHDNATCYKAAEVVEFLAEKISR